VNLVYNLLGNYNYNCNFNYKTHEIYLELWNYKILQHKKRRLRIISTCNTSHYRIFNKSNAKPTSQIWSHVERSETSSSENNKLNINYIQYKYKRLTEGLEVFRVTKNDIVLEETIWEGRIENPASDGSSFIFAFTFWPTLQPAFIKITLRYYQKEYLGTS
jgi:hypothetical protein